MRCVAFLVRLLRRNLPVLALLAGLAVPAMAEAVSGAIRGREEAGFGRLILTFPEPVMATARMAGGVLIVSFDRPVKIDPEKTPVMLPGYVAAARLDPDQRSLRFAVTRPLKVNLKDAAEQVYVDLVPEGWAGPPPPLPPDVVRDLARRARVAAEAVRDAQLRPAAPVLRTVVLRVVGEERRKRLVFELPEGAGAIMSHEGARVTVGLSGRVELNETAVRAALSGHASDPVLEQQGGDVRLSFTMPADRYSAETEGQVFFVDLEREVQGPQAQRMPVASKPIEREPDVTPLTAPATAPAPQAMPEVPAAPARPAVRERPVPQSSRVRLSILPPGSGEGLRLRVTPRLPAAVFEQGDSLMVLLQGAQSVELPPLSAFGGVVSDVRADPFEGAAAIRVVPEKRGLVSVTAEPDAWVIDLSEQFAGASEPVRWSRASGADGRRVLRGALAQAGDVIAFEDPDTAEKLLVVPTLGRVSAVLASQNFVDFRLPRTALGVVVQPRADDVHIRSELDSVVISREAGLTLSPDGPASGTGAQAAQDLVVSAERWTEDRRGSIRDAGRALLRAAADAPRRERTAARLRLAQFHLANGFAVEANGVLALAGQEDVVAGQAKPLLMFRLIAAAMNGDHAEANRIGALPVLALDGEAGLWRAYLDVQGRRHGRALVGFRKHGDILDQYPGVLQALIRPAVIEAAVEEGDTYLANQHLGELERLDAEDRHPTVLALWQGRIGQASGRSGEALTAYAIAAKSPLRPVEAQARLYRVLLQLREGAIEAEAGAAELETIAMIWRRGEVEVSARAKLGEIHAARSEWREAFQAARRASEILPDHPTTRRLQDDMGRKFEDLFLSGKAESLSRVEALAIFDEFRSLIPIGARGDEIVRRLADRLYDLDLLDQASDLLAYQVQHRLKGVARSQVATRLAVVHLVNGKPHDALQALKTSRLASMPPDLRRARVLLEARTLADLSRTELALEVLAAEAGEDVERLRADILWRGKRWREAAETYERALGTRWREDTPLADGERGDIVRAAVAYVLASDRLGVDRLRAKFLPRMADSPDADTFKLITLDNLARPQEFREVARSVVSSETLQDFLEAYRKRYPGEAAGSRKAGAPASGAG